MCGQTVSFGQGGVWRSTDFFTHGYSETRSLAMMQQHIAAASSSLHASAHRRTHCTWIRRWPISIAIAQSQHADSQTQTSQTCTEFFFTQKRESNNDNGKYEKKRRCGSIVSHDFLWMRTTCDYI